MHRYILWFSMHITGGNAINSYAWVHFLFSMHITGENTVNSYACVYLVVFSANY